MKSLQTEMGHLGEYIELKYLRDIRGWYRQVWSQKEGWKLDFEHLQYKMSFALLLVCVFCFLVFFFGERQFWKRPYW